MSEDFPFPMPPAVRRYVEIWQSVFQISPRLRERPGRLSSRPSEIELQARWFAGDFGREFISEDGEKVTIVQFGEWNRGAGPDFFQAVVEIDGTRSSGDLEIDWNVSDWDGHGHATNVAFENVVLHVFADREGERRYFTRDHRHRAIPQVRINPAQLDPASWLKSQALARVGRCSQPLAAMTPGDIDTLLTAAAHYRVLRKAARFLRISRCHGEDEALWQLLAEALGYKNNKLAMTLLAQRLPLRHLQQRKSEAESLLFGHAGFLGRPTYDEADPDAREYLRLLWENWWKDRPEALRPIPWILTGTRPMNHPQRRLGALAAILGAWRKISPFVRPDGFSSTRATEIFANLKHDFWEWHYTVAARRCRQPMVLIGDSRIADLLGNIFFPIAIAQESDGSAWREFLSLRAELGNTKLERAEIRLFGSRPDAAKFRKRYYQQQGLLQIYDDFCLVDESDCAHCPFPEQLAHWRMESDTRFSDV